MNGSATLKNEYGIFENFMWRHTIRPMSQYFILVAAIFEN